jgi:hypothetical protein
MPCTATATCPAPRSFRTTSAWARCTIRRWCSASARPRPMRLPPRHRMDLRSHARRAAGLALGPQL